jgi:trehalose/maltose hydrolase-like predicted phosphorylase
MQFGATPSGTAVELITLRNHHGMEAKIATYGGIVTALTAPDRNGHIADVNLLAYPLQEVTDPAVIKRDLDYYTARADEHLGPAMTKSIFAILRQRLGQPEEAFRLFQSGYKPNERPPFGVIAENATSKNPYFATGAGGLLQTLLYGFGGLDITDQGLIHRPGPLPVAWKSITLKGIGPEKRTYRNPTGSSR